VVKNIPLISQPFLTRSVKCYGGHVWANGSIEKGYVSVEDGIVTGTYTTPEVEPSLKGLVIPRPINAHVHSGDRGIKDMVRRHLKKGRSLNNIVAPPNGIKHRHLENTDDDQLILDMTIYIKEAFAAGCGGIVDFREGGIRGLRILKQAAGEIPIRAEALGRPAGLSYDPVELNAILDRCSGISVSALCDWEPSELEKVAKHVHGKKGRFALHASENIRENIDDILELGPDFLVHMVKGTDSDFQRLAQENVPVAVCPRANALFGLKAPMDKLVRNNVEFALGTDNAMSATPDIFSEMGYTLRHHSRHINPDRLWHGQQLVGKKIINGQQTLSGTTGERADFLVLSIPPERFHEALAGGDLAQRISLIMADGRPFSPEELIEQKVDRT